MGVDHNFTQPRTLAGRSDSELIAINTMEATDDELRKIVLRLVETTPHRQHMIRCPFRVLNTLAYATYTNLVHGLDRAALLSLLKTERECFELHQLKSGPPGVNRAS